MATNTIDTFLGKGITFPLELNSKGAAIIKSEVELIKSSLRSILSWPNRQRFFNRNFGSRLEELLEEPVDAVTKSLALRFAREAVESWEKRIELLDASITDVDNEKFNIVLEYRIINNKTQDTFIFPFYTKLNY